MLHRATLLTGSITIVFIWFCVYLLLSKPGVEEHKEELSIVSHTIAVNPGSNGTLSECASSIDEDAKKTTRCESGRKGKCQLQCSPGTFSLESWITCKDYLNCNEIAHDVRRVSVIGIAGNWKLYSAEWIEYEVIYAELNTEDFDKVDIDLQSLHGLFAQPNFLYVIGHCKESNVLIFSRSSAILGTARQLDVILNETGCNNWMTRFRLCMGYIRTLHRLHTNPSGKLVLCNSHSLQHLLSQFVITEDFNLILTGYDNLPAIGSGIKCSQTELYGNFIAPEQKWPFSQIKVFNNQEQPTYNHKSDIWKIPHVVKFFMSAECEGCVEVLDYLFVIFHHCKKIQPIERPSAETVLKEFEDVWRMIIK